MKFQNGDTIMARITPCLENGKTAYINFLDENEVAFGSTEYIVLSAKEGFCSELLYFLARHDDFVSYAVAHMNGSSGRQRVSGSDIANYEMPEITNETLDFVSDKLHGIMEVIKNNSLESRRLASLRDTLLPRLMSGELKVNEIENLV
jgi:type I restriction enzyme S subunit